MKHFQKLCVLAFAALSFAACDKVGLSGLGGVKMDSEEAVTKAKALAAENIKPGEWKVIGVTWLEGSTRDELSNNVSSVSFEMVDKDGRVWQQSYLADLGWKATELSGTNWDTFHKGVDAKELPGFDMDKMNAADVIKDIEEAKKMIPEGYEFKSVDMYEINSYGTDRASITLNVVEKGKETVSNAGQTSIVFYELKFNKGEDGKLNMLKN